VSLAFLLNQKVTPLAQWSKPKDDTEPRPSDLKRKEKHKNRVEQCFESLKKPMNAIEMGKELGVDRDCAYRYLALLFSNRRIHRSSKQPYVYWKL